MKFGPVCVNAYLTLQKLTNRAGRLITISNYSIRSDDILDTLGWDTLKQKCTKYMPFSVFKARNNFYPTRLNPMFEPTSNIYSYNWGESSNNIVIPRSPTEAARRRFIYRGDVLWNDLKTKLTVLSVKVAHFKYCFKFYIY